MENRSKNQRPANEHAADGQREERGATAVQYALIMTLVAMVTVFAMRDTADESAVEIEYLAASIEGEILDSDGGGFGGSSESGSSESGSSGSSSGVGSSAVNQSFENGTSNTTFYNEGDMLGIWTIAEGSVDSFSIDRPRLSAKWADTGATTPDGQKILDLNGREPGAIETELRVAREADYDLSFLVSENHYCTGSTVADGVARTGQVLWNGEVVQTFSVDADYGEFDVVTAVLPGTESGVGVLRIESTMSGTCGPAIESASISVALR